MTLKNSKTRPFKHYLISIVTLLGVTLLQGCTLQSIDTAPENVKPASNDTDEQFRPFAPETLYSLMVAEIASGRGRYDVTLGNYMQQAKKTRDPGIAARATRFAHLLEARQATLDSAILWVDIAPDDKEARLIAATELANHGRLLEAFEHSTYLLEHGEKGIFQTIASKAEQATDIQREVLLINFNELLINHPDNLQLVVGKGLLLQQQTHFEKALLQANTALEQDPTFIPAAILQAQLLTLLERPEEAISSLHAMLLKHPENKRLRLQYARILTKYDLNKAQEQFSILSAQSPDDPDLILSLALINTEQQNFAEAKTQFQQLLALDKHISTSRYYLGLIAEQSSDYQQAIRHYFQVMPGRDFLPSIYRAVALMVSHGDVKSANYQLEQLRALYPKTGERLYKVQTEILIDQGHLTEALEIFTAALDKYPTSTSLLYGRATLYEELDNIGSAEEDFRTILRYDPNNVDTLNALGYTLTNRTNRHEEAYEYISKALNLQPNDPAIIDSMGWVQYRLGNYEEAITRLRQAFKLLPDHEIAAHLGEVLWITGAQQEAMEIWTKSLSATPDSHHILDTMERLGVTP